MKEKIISFIFICFIFIIGFTFIIKEDTKISLTERRKLTTKENLKKDFIDNLDKYMSEQIIFRNELIKMNNIYNRYILNNFEHNGVYTKEEYIIEKNYPLNDKNINNFINKINYINSNLNSKNKYYTIIPDKSYYLSDEYLKINYEDMVNTLTNNINIKYIDILNDFELTDYFKTDIHLKQESYFKVLPKILKNYNQKFDAYEFEKKEYSPFYGSSYFKYGLSNPDTLEYYTNVFIKTSKVNYLEYDNNKIYEEGKLGSIDSYDLFLNGPSALIEIETKSNSNSELIIFRDSYASSLTPLLTPYYKKITLIDLRYIDYSIVKNMVDYTNKDILFIYSPLIINNSSILKVKY